MQQDLKLLLENKHPNPHSFLGLQKDVIRVFNPKAKDIYLQIKDDKIKMQKAHISGLFEHRLEKSISHLDYQIYTSEKKAIFDAFSFKTSFNEIDLDELLNSTNTNLYNFLGAHKKTYHNVQGVEFSVYAHNALGISVIGNFNDWIANMHPLININFSGFWQIFIPHVKESSLYKFLITTQDGKILKKSDPFAFFSELRPNNSSIVKDVNSFQWSDQNWLKKRSQKDLNRPINIYEVHLQSWIKKENCFFLDYKTLAHKLVSYLKMMNYNYIEIMPILEHPLDDSWGYQVSGYFSVTSRYGSLDDFQYFVNYMHENNIGVILDWVPAHFVKDDFALKKFDGSYLFEPEDEAKREHLHWDTYIFDYKKKFTQNFLISSAMFFLEKYHIDGLRVDAVSSMLFLDFENKNDSWLPNKHGDNRDLEAIEFIKLLNSEIKKRFSDVLVIAEEASSYKGVTDKDNLNFDLKWNMGWMQDTLTYLQGDIDKREEHHNDLTFSLMYSFNEKFILPFSHDEVVHIKNSLFSKMQGKNTFEKFANYRLLYSYFICHPGKKLSFMGNEIAQIKEWDNFSEVSWELLKDQNHLKHQLFVKYLNHLYLNSSALFEDDFSFAGFKWVHISDRKNSILSYFRIAKKQKLFIIHNFSKNDLKDYEIAFKEDVKGDENVEIKGEEEREKGDGNDGNIKNSIQELKVIFDTDLKRYGGSFDNSKDNSKTIKISQNILKLDLAKFSSKIFEVIS